MADPDPPYPAATANLVVEDADAEFTFLEAALGVRVCHRREDEASVFPEVDGVVAESRGGRELMEEIRRREGEDLVMAGRTSGVESSPVTRHRRRAVDAILKPEIPAKGVPESYRWRWQIEADFKRRKSMLSLGHLPKEAPPAHAHGCRECC
jgi:hypothetical protein